MTVVFSEAWPKRPDQRRAALYHVTPSVVQRALDRVEAAMGSVPFFVTGGKRTAKLSDAGERFLPLAHALIEAWNAALSEGTAK